MVLDLYFHFSNTLIYIRYFRQKDTKFLQPKIKISKFYINFNIFSHKLQYFFFTKKRLNYNACPCVLSSFPRNVPRGHFLPLCLYGLTHFSHMPFHPISVYNLTEIVDMFNLSTSCPIKLRHVSISLTVHASPAKMLNLMILPLPHQLKKTKLAIKHSLLCSWKSDN